MNQRIKELMNQAGIDVEAVENLGEMPTALKFAELMIRECAENFAKVWYEQGLDIRGAELDKFMKRFKEHFGVKE